MTLMERLIAQRDAAQEEVDAVVRAADEHDNGEGQERGRDLTDDELAQVRGAREKIDGLNTRISEEGTAAERRANAVRADLTAEPTQERRAPVSTTTPRTYRRNGPNSFFSDAFRAVKLGDANAAARLAQHAREVEVEGELAARDGSDDAEQRDLITTGFGGMVVPVYLVNEFAEVLRNGRAMANAVRRLPLPAQGMSLVVPRAVSGSAVAVQATQNAAIQETDLNFNNDLIIPVVTIAGMQDVSRQALERGAPGLDDLVYADLVADYAAKLDLSIIQGDGTGGTHKGLHNTTGENVVTYNDATPTQQEFWPKLADANQRVGSNRKIPANLIAMHPRRWGWWVAALDADGRPLVPTGGPADAVNAMGVTQAEKFGEGQIVGTLQGLPVIADGNMPTTITADAIGAGTEDEVFVMRRQDPILWEENDGQPRRLRFEEASGNPMTIRLAVYGYSAFTSDRQPTGLSRITGTGLVAPTF